MTAFSVRRQCDIASDPVDVHDMINDFRRWLAWSPWERYAPYLSRSFTGAPAGVGAIYVWSGHDDLTGAGRLEITHSTLASIEMLLTYTAPFEISNALTFTLTPIPAGTRLEWQISGDGNPRLETVGRSKWLNSVTKELDQGLQSIKLIVEA